MSAIVAIMDTTQAIKCDLQPRQIIDQQFNGDEEAYIQSLVGMFDRQRKDVEEHTERLKRIKEFSRWKTMIRRCWDKNMSTYKYYGGRGIKVCDRWLQFENFFADMGIAPDGHSLDRIDPNGNYEPSNCRWATILEQAHNKRKPVKVRPIPTGKPRQTSVGSVCLINGKWRSLVRVMGQSKSKYFSDRDEAVLWGKETSALLRAHHG